jgi:hypothetical protein
MNPMKIVFITVVWAAPLYAQLDLLTVREAESIIERIPGVVEAKERGQCPQSSATYQEMAHFSFQVRSSCGSSGGMLIGNYDLNRRTGAVTLWGDNPLPVADVAGKELAASLVRQAQGRILSTNEARCLALEAARALPGWSADDSSVTVKPFGKAERGAMRFTAQHSIGARPATSGRMLTVNLATARIRDDQVGMDVMSESLGSLTSKIVELRKPLWLSDEDAVSIVSIIPTVASRLRDGCKLATGGAFRSTEAIVGLSCEGQNADGGSVAVNLQTGAVTDADTGKVLESSEGARITRRLIDSIQQRRSELQAEISSACRQQ